MRFCLGKERAVKKNKTRRIRPGARKNCEHIQAERFTAGGGRNPQGTSMYIGYDKKVQVRGKKNRKETKIKTRNLKIDRMGKGERIVFSRDKIEQATEDEDTGSFPETICTMIEDEDNRSLPRDIDRMSEPQAEGNGISPGKIESITEDEDDDPFRGKSDHMSENEKNVSPCDKFDSMGKKEDNGPFLGKNDGMSGDDDCPFPGKNDGLSEDDDCPLPRKERWYVG